MTHRDAVTQAELQNTKNCFNLTVLMSVLVAAASFVFQLFVDSSRQRSALLLGGSGPAGQHAACAAGGAAEPGQGLWKR